MVYLDGNTTLFTFWESKKLKSRGEAEGEGGEEFLITKYNECMSPHVIFKHCKLFHILSQ